MACFLVPATEAIVTTIAAKIVKKREEKKLLSHKSESECTEIVPADSAENTVSFSKKLNRLSGFLWGGSGLLAFEHLWHGEISPVFPFLTAAKDPSQMTEVFHEMSTVGVGMALAVTLFWAFVTLGYDYLQKHSAQKTISTREVE